MHHLQQAAGSLGDLPTSAPAEIRRLAINKESWSRVSVRPNSTSFFPAKKLLVERQADPLEENGRVAVPEN